MNEKIIREKYVLEYIKDILSTYSYALKNVDDAKYHHNASYKDARFIIKYGILSMEEINKLGIKSYSEEDLNLMDDIESHVNGKDGVSLSIVGLGIGVFSKDCIFNIISPAPVVSLLL